MMKVFGHRGAKGLAPENTIASFLKALEYPIDAIELDVFLSKDGHLICNHDPDVLSGDGVPHRITTATYTELVAFKSDLTTLPKTIEVIDRRVPIIIEIKEDTPGEAVADCVQAFLDKGWQMSDFEFCSFLFQPLKVLRERFPDAEIIPNVTWSSFKGRYWARKLNTRRIAMKERWLWRGYLRMMQRGGWQLSAYTVNNPARAHKWAPYIYGIYTDYPDRFTDLMKSGKP